MTMRDRLDALYEEIPPHLAPALDNVIRYAFKAPYDHAAYVLQQELNEEEPNIDHCLGLLDEIEWALDRYFQPVTTQLDAYKKDKKTWLRFMRRFLEGTDEEGQGISIDGARQNVVFFFNIFSPGGKEKCGHPLMRCQYADKGAYGGTDLHCMHSFGGDFESHICPDCGAPRRLCTQSPKANGYCRFHGGKADSLAAANGDMPIFRAERVYGRVLTGEMHAYFQQFREDPNFLNLTPELNLARAKLAKRLSKLDEFDPLLIRSGIERALTQVRKALDEEKPYSAYGALQQVESYLHQAGRGSRNDSEIDNSIMLIKQLAEAERRRIIDAQQMIPRQEMAVVVEETIREVYALLETLAGKTYEQVKQALYKHFPKESSRIVEKFGDLQMKQLMFEMMAQEMSDALTRAEQEQYREQMRDEQLALIEGEDYPYGEEADS